MQLSGFVKLCFAAILFLAVYFSDTAEGRTKFIGKRRGHMFVGKRTYEEDDVANNPIPDYFAQKRRQYFVGKRRNNAFIGKREYENDDEDAEKIDDIIQDLLNKRGGRKFIG